MMEPGAFTDVRQSDPDRPASIGTSAVERCEQAG